MSKHGITIGSVVQIHFPPPYISNRRSTGEMATVIGTGINSEGIPIALVEIHDTGGDCDALVFNCLKPLFEHKHQATTPTLQSKKYTCGND